MLKNRKKEFQVASIKPEMWLVHFRSLYESNRNEDGEDETTIPRIEHTRDRNYDVVNIAYGNVSSTMGS